MGRSVVFSAFYADFCFCSKLVIITTLTNQIRVCRCELCFLAVYAILFYSWEGRRGTTDEFAIIPFHLVLLSAALVELAKSIPVHSLILSAHLFFCPPLFLFPFSVPCRIVFAQPQGLATWPNHLSLRFLTRIRSSSYSPMAALIFLRTSSLLTYVFEDKLTKY